MGARRKGADTEADDPCGRATRRTEGVYTEGRSARVVDAVFRATAQELSRCGYALLRVEDVATRSGVNKTTIYRRWPSKAELVAATLAEPGVLPDPPDTGTLRGDLLETVHRMTALASSPLGRGFLRVIQAERGDPEVDRIARTLRKRNRGVRRMLIERGIARGELPQGTDPDLVGELVFAPIMSRVITFQETLEEGFAEQIIDFVLRGAHLTWGEHSRK